MSKYHPKSRKVVAPPVKFVPDDTFAIMPLKVSEKTNLKCSSNESLPSTFGTNDTPVLCQVNELFNEYKVASQRPNVDTGLEQETCQLLIREHPPLVYQEFQKRLESHGCKTEIHHFDVKVPNTDGLFLDLSIDQQLGLLRQQERFLTVCRWRQLWEETRPPCSKWYELKNSRFSNEMEKCRKMLNPSNQVLQYQVRSTLINYKRMLEFDAQV